MTKTRPGTATASSLSYFTRAYMNPPHPPPPPNAKLEGLLRQFDWVYCIFLRCCPDLQTNSITSSWSWIKMHHQFPIKIILKTKPTISIIQVWIWNQSNLNFTIATNFHFFWSFGEPKGASKYSTRHCAVHSLSNSLKQTNFHKTFQCKLIEQSSD